MTKSQEMILERVKKAIPKNFFHSENYEIKEFEVTKYDHFISVYASIGLKEDEGTMAAVFCRDTFHIFIGKKRWCEISYVECEKERAIYKNSHQSRITL